MKVLVAGATGALGKQLVPRLVANRHDVAGITRSPSKQDAVRALGARPIVADALDPDQVARAVAETEPDVIVHELTALSGPLDMRHWDRYFALTNRLRTEGADHLLAAGRAAGVERFVAQSYAGWPFARSGGPVKSEDDPLDPNPAEQMRETLAAIRHLEQAVLGADWTEGVVLRYGGVHRPGNALAARGEDRGVLPRPRVPVGGVRSGGRFPGPPRAGSAAACGAAAGPGSGGRGGPLGGSGRSRPRRPGRSPRGRGGGGASKTPATTARRRAPGGCPPRPLQRARSRR